MRSRSLRRGLLLGLVLAAAVPAPAMAAPADYDTPGTTGASPPANPSPPPSVTGTAQVGGRLTGSRGTWAEDLDPTSEWLRCDAAARTCETTGDTDLTYLPTAADLGKTMILRVVGSQTVLLFTSTRTADAVSNPIAAAPTIPTAPKNVVAPRITGDLRVGKTLGVALGQWTGTAPITYDYKWASCADKGACRAAGTGRTYRVKSTDAGRVLLLAVTATNAVGNAGILVPTGLVPATTAGLRRLAPFPTVLIDGRVAGAVTRISTLRFRKVPGGSTIKAACTGRGCPFRTSTIKVRKGKSRTVALPRLQRAMRAGTTVVITVRKGTTIGKYVRLRFRSGSAPARVDRCVVPGSAKPVKCP